MNLLNNMAALRFLFVSLITVLSVEISTPFTQALVIKSKAENTRNTPVRHTSSTLPIANNAERKSFTGKIGGFVGGKMFDYFLTRYLYSLQN
jgi:hypothetical protein